MRSERVLVTGANGFVGRHLCERLLAAGYRVRGAVRSPSARVPDGVEAVVVDDLGPTTDWSRALDGVDVVAHLAARVHQMRDPAPDPAGAYRRVNVEGTRCLAASAAGAGVRRFAFVSTVKVHGEATDGRPFRESDPPAPVDPYGVSKLEAERALRSAAAASGMQAVVLRPPLVYGAGVRANFQRLAEGVARGLPLPLGGIRNQRSLVYVGNLADAIRACIEHPAAAGETFLVSDGVPLSTPDLVRGIARAVGVAPRLIGIPPRVLRGAARLVGRGAAVDRLESSLVVDDRKIRALLGWEPPFSLEDGLAETVRAMGGPEPRGAP